MKQREDISAASRVKCVHANTEQSIHNICNIWIILLSTQKNQHIKTQYLYKVPVHINLNSS